MLSQKKTNNMADYTESWYDNFLNVNTINRDLADANNINAGIAGSVSDRAEDAVVKAIDASWNIVTNVVNTNLDTEAKKILWEFVFWASWAIAIATDANNGLWISPTGILAKKTGNNTLSIAIDGTAIFSWAVTGATINVPNATTPLFSVDSLGNVVAKSLQRKDFHIFTLFESIDGYGQGLVWAWSITCANWWVTIVTWSITNNTSSLSKDLSWSFSFDKKTRIKFWFTLSQITDHNIHVINWSNTTNKHIWFYFTSWNVYWTTHNGTNQTTVSLWGADTSYNDYEVVYTPGVSAIFYKNWTELWTITTNLPSGSTGASSILLARVKTLAASAKTATISWYDFWQEI